jgi:hypothetical protein
MNQHQSQGDPFAINRRQAIKTRCAGKHTRCACGEARIEALIANTGVCMRCQRRRGGKNTLDEHHVAGKNNSPVTLPTDVNDHRQLSEAQRAWPRKTVENPEGCPLIAAAGSIRGFADYVLYLIDHVLRWIAEMLEILSEYLKEQHGPRWWINTPLNRFSKRS